MIPSSTSRFLASMAVLRVESVACWVSSPAIAALFVSRTVSSSEMRLRRAFRLSVTADSALARDLRRALRRAA